MLIGGSIDARRRENTAWRFCVYRSRPVRRRLYCARYAPAAQGIVHAQPTVNGGGRRLIVRIVRFVTDNYRNYCVSLLLCNERRRRTPRFTESNRADEPRRPGEINASDICARHGKTGGQERRNAGPPMARRRRTNKHRRRIRWSTLRRRAHHASVTAMHRTSSITSRPRTSDCCRFVCFLSLSCPSLPAGRFVSARKTHSPDKRNLNSSKKKKNSNNNIKKKRNRTKRP